ncbi:putative bifunctional diguanylate cyclase/phosphodiesterase [Methylophilus sp. 'Pure River']|uniref:putative bifunctional diguanylate cyclase/phosphodiesterase n=1 Tax=Methylophilus sp. 'Pure River' TaxID=3377117 RepID=UPI00398ED588
MSAQQFTSAGRGKLIRRLWLMVLFSLLICLALTQASLTALTLPSATHKLVVLLLSLGVALWGVLTILIWQQQRTALAMQAADLQTFNRVLADAYASDTFSPVMFAPTESASVEEGWQQLRTQLTQLDSDGASVKQHHQQLNQLYLALSQCNQAIVQSQDKHRLFEQICQIIVNLGHANMAWIGELDRGSKQIVVSSAFGSGINYLDEVLISADPAAASGRGPCGLSMLSDHPYWVHDFQTNPISAVWHDKATEFAWKAAAFLPLHAEGKVIGCLSLYAEHEQAFEPDIQRLLQGMVANIDFALDRFEVQAQNSLFQTNLLKSEQRAQLVLENALDAIVNIDLQGLIVEWNRAAAQMFGYTRAEVVGRMLEDVIVPPAYREAHHQGMQRLQQSGHSRLLGKLIEITALRRDGSEFPVELTIVEIKRDHEHYYSAFIRDITARKEAEERIRFLANYDALTGLPNRNLLTERVIVEIEKAWDQDGQFALMFLDLDHFKDVNDSLGHRYGDNLLVALTHRFQSLVRPQDTICRLGGDEFVFLLAEADHVIAKEVVERLLKAVEQPFVIDQYELTITASVGVAIYPDDGLDMESLQRNADVAMYRTKKESRNSYRFFSNHMQVQTARNLQLVNALRQAIALGQLAVYYQPQVALDSGRLIGVEALLRWKHPQLGFISPAEFIPLAESSGLIISIGSWVLEQATQQIHAWQLAGIRDISVSVNLSSIQFRDPKLPALVKSVLERYQVSPQCLELELTEGVALENPEGAVAMMDALSGLGVRLSIDDFGTGYSSLSYLKKFKVYKLKVDQSFVRDITTDDEDKAIVIAIIQLARSLGMKTIAEGVETPEQKAFLQTQGCDEMQGYLLSKPLSSNDATTFLLSY